MPVSRGVSATPDCCRSITENLRQLAAEGAPVEEQTVDQQVDWLQAALSSPLRYRFQAAYLVPVTDHSDILFSWKCMKC